MSSEQTRRTSHHTRMPSLETLSRPISPPPPRNPPPSDTSTTRDKAQSSKVAAAAAIEAGIFQIRDHLSYFSNHFDRIARPRSSTPRLSLDRFRALYLRNQHDRGRHFVVHQHDHPVAGVHYDLRLQFSRSSSISFAIPYGLPGNPNSLRPNRLGIETRVHNLWNHLIESASHATGSLLIWDTGEYEVLPSRQDDLQTARQGQMTDDENSPSNGEPSDVPACGGDDGCPSQSERLVAAFRSRHIRLRLNGTRLPANYTMNLRLPAADRYTNQAAGPRKKARKSLRRVKNAPVDSDESHDDGNDMTGSCSTALNHDPPVRTDAEEDQEDDETAAVAAASEDEQDDALIRANNAYPGAVNSIGSIHQRHWFVTLDRQASGFRRARGEVWEGPWEHFIVRGRDFETSVVTGRMADQVMADEGVESFVRRKMWRPIVE